MKGVISISLFIASFLVIVAWLLKVFGAEGSNQPTLELLVERENASSQIIRCRVELEENLCTYTRVFLVKSKICHRTPSRKAALGLNRTQYHAAVP